MPVSAESKAATLTVYSRQGCHLCEELIESLLPLVRGRLDIEVIDVDTSAALREIYGERVPVLEHAGCFICQYTLDEAALRALLARIFDEQAREIV